MIALLPRTHRYVLGFVVNSVKSIAITNALVYRSGRCWCVLKRCHAERREKDVTITVPQWVCGLLKLSARNGELQNLYLLVFPLAFKHWSLTALCCVFYGIL